MDLMVISYIYMTSDYIKVLENNLLPFVERIYGANYVFQQNNDRIHTSKLMRTFFNPWMPKVTQLPVLAEGVQVYPETFMVTEHQPKVC